MTAIQAERDAAKAEKAKARAEQKAKEAAEKAAQKAEAEEGAEGDGEPKPEEEKPAEEAEEGAPTPETPEQPINIDIEANSDDDFEPISIKEKVREHFAEFGDDCRLPTEIINEAVRWRLERNDC